MLERHYSKLKPHMRLGSLSGNDKKNERIASKSESEELTLLRDMLKQQQAQVEIQEQLIKELRDRSDG